MVFVYLRFKAQTAPERMKRAFLFISRDRSNMNMTLCFVDESAFHMYTALE
jgi:hypothetical protein